MKKVYVISIFCTLFCLFITGSALAQVFTPAECAEKLDPAKCCAQPADEASRVETARSVIKVCGRPDPSQPDGKDVDHYHKIINKWAVNGSGEDGEGEDGAVYRESTLAALSRQEMYDYLDVVFVWSSDQVLVTMDELWKTHDDDSMTYMVVNKWVGSTDAGYYEQPGISIVEFRPGEGCVAYQRDYFSEGDTYWGMEGPHLVVKGNRNTTISELGLTHRCIDDDSDGYTKYIAATGCTNGTTVDCNDYNAAINPGATEVPGNGLDDDCDPATSDCLGLDSDEDGYFIGVGNCGVEDCDDGNDAVNPGMTEIGGNGLDDDCDPATLDCTDSDEDGFAVEGGVCGPEDCNDGDDTVNPDMTEIPGNEKDDDCNLSTSDCLDSDEDGYFIGAGNCGVEDCDDGDDTVNPDMTEIGGNGLDDDCDPATLDCTDSDEDGFAVEGGVCGFEDCDDEDEMVNPNMTEIPGNEKDDDCNPETLDEITPPCFIGVTAF